MTAVVASEAGYGPPCFRCTLATNAAGVCPSCGPAPLPGPAVVERVMGPWEHQAVCPLCGWRHDLVTPSYHVALAAAEAHRCPPACAVVDSFPIGRDETVEAVCTAPAGHAGAHVWEALP